MIRFEHVTITYPEHEQPTLRDIELEIPAGELCVVIGATGTGKTTLLGAINGLVPHLPVGRCAAASRSTGATRGPSPRASWPTSLAS